MTQQQIDTIQLKLDNWRKERHLSQNDQIKGIIPNLLEEVAEYFRAKDNNEKIDALCDILVFSFNSYKNKFPVEKFRDEPSMAIVTDVVTDFIDNSDEINDISLGIIIRNCFQLIETLNYDPYLCLLETINEISSRKGIYDDNVKKFIKFDGAYDYYDACEKIQKINPKFNIISEDNLYWIYGDIQKQGQLVKWYKADYRKCRIFH